MLSVRELEAGYGSVRILKGVNIEVGEGEVVAVLGANGAGKTTTLRTISGFTKVWKGTVEFKGRDLRSVAADARARAGIGHVPEGRGIIGALTVQENLTLGIAARPKGAGRPAEDLAWVADLFPILTEKMSQRSSSLSGGQQQMLALARTLISRPPLMLVDEMSFGLAPSIIEQLFDVVGELRTRGQTFLLVDQNTGVLRIADRAYVISGGQTVLERPAADLLDAGRSELARIYMGVDSE